MPVATGTYTTISRPGGPYTEHRWRLTPRTDPSPDGFFWAHQMGFETATGSAYVGLQTNGSGIGGDGKCVVFSIGDAIDAAPGDLADTIITADFDAAPGYSTRAPFSWTVGRTYELAISKGATDGDGQWWVATVTDTLTGVTATVSSIKVPSAWGDLIYLTVAFTERFSGPTDSCSSIRFASADFTNFVSVQDGLDVAADGITSELGAPEDGCPSSRVSAVPAGARHEIGIPAPVVVPRGEWRLELCNNDHDLTSLDPPVIIAEVAAGTLTGRKPQSSAGTMTLQLPDDMAVLPQITPDRVLRFDQWDPELGDGGGWAPFFAAYPRRQRLVKVNRGGKGARLLRWDCQGIASDFDATVVHARNAPAIPFSSKRAFDWRTPELPTDTWADPDERGLQGDKTLTPPAGYAGLPRNYPNPLARHIWVVPPSGGADPPGFGVFDGEFTIADVSLVRFYPVADDLYDLAVAGESIMQFLDRSATAFTPEWRPLRLQPGTYTVRGLVENVDHPEIANNSASFCISIGREVTETIYGAPRVTEEWLLVTGAPGWKTISGASMPGFRFGHRFGILMDESSGRDEIPGWTRSFDDSLDTDGAAWPTSNGNIYDVLASLSDILSKDVGEGWVEWSPPASSKTLDAYVVQGTVRLDAALNRGESLTDLSTDEDLGPTVTGLEVGYRGGFTSVGAGPRRRGFSTDAETEAEALQLASAELGRLDPHAQQGVTLQIDPIDRARTPGLGFDLGDTIPVDTDLMRARAFAWQVKGRRIIWTPEFGTIREEQADRQARIARRVVPGGLSGRSESVAPTTPLQPAGGTLGAEVLTWGVDSSLEDTLPPQALLHEGRGHHLRVIAGEHPPIGGNMIWYLQVNGQDAYGPFTLPQGPPLSGIDDIDDMPQEWESTALVIHGGPGIFFAPRIHLGSGHGALTFELTAAPYPG